VVEQTVRRAGCRDAREPGCQRHGRDCQLAFLEDWRIMAFLKNFL
jgi:hypothetical protein